MHPPSHAHISPSHQSITTINSNINDYWAVNGMMGRLRKISIIDGSTGSNPFLTGQSHRAGPDGVLKGSKDERVAGRGGSFAYDFHGGWATRRHWKRPIPVQLPALPAIELARTAPKQLVHYSYDSSEFVC